MTDEELKQLVQANAQAIAANAHAIESSQHRFDSLETRLGGLESNLEDLTDETKRLNDRVEIYQKASQQVVNLAFGLLATAALAIIIPALLNR